MREKGCARGAHRARGDARAVMSDTASIRRCRGAGDVSTSSRDSRRRGMHARDARDVVRACAMGGRDDEPVYDAAFARSRVDVADARRARHGTARHGARMRETPDADIGGGVIIS
jgi:hypothetical protein